MRHQWERERTGNAHAVRCVWLPAKKLVPHLPHIMERAPGRPQKCTPAKSNSPSLSICRITTSLRMLRVMLVACIKILEFEGTTIAGLLLRCRMLVEEDEISLRGLTATPPQCCHHRTAHPSPHGCPPPWLPSSTADAPAAMCPPRCSRQGHVSPTLLRPCCEQQMCTCLYALNLHPVTPFLLLHYRRYSVR